MFYCYTFVLFVSLDEAGGLALNVVDSEVCLAITLYRDESETVQGSWTTTRHLEKNNTSTSIRQGSPLFSCLVSNCE
jgi:hypothetical protein